MENETNNPEIKLDPDYHFEVVETVDKEKDIHRIEIGNSGLQIDFYPDAWALTFMPDSGINKPTNRNEIYLNGLLFTRAMYESVNWFESKGNELDPKGFVRNDTTESMHNFRKKLFGELSEKTGIDGIYTETGRFHENYEYELRYDLLTNAIRQIESEMPEEERNKLRFFKYLEKSKENWD